MEPPGKPGRFRGLAALGFAADYADRLASPLSLDGPQFLAPAVLEGPRPKGGRCPVWSLLTVRAPITFYFLGAVHNAHAKANNG